MRILRGEVISDKMAQTVVVIVRRVKIHPLYRKKMTQVKKYHVHDEIGVNKGDQVEFLPSRPYAKTKRWQIVKVLNKKGSEEK